MKTGVGVCIITVLLLVTSMMSPAVLAQPGNDNKPNHSDVSPGHASAGDASAGPPDHLEDRERRLGFSNEDEDPEKSQRGLPQKDSDKDRQQPHPDNRDKDSEFDRSDEEKNMDSGSSERETAIKNLIPHPVFQTSVVETKITTEKIQEVPVARTVQVTIDRKVKRTIKTETTPGSTNQRIKTKIETEA